MELIINKIIDNFDFNYILCINIITYCIIKTIDNLNKNKKVKTYQKRIVLVFSIILISVVYKILGYENNILMLNSALFSPIAWSWIFKPFMEKIGLGYKK